jgi:hypothetical protein
MATIAAVTESSQTSDQASIASPIESRTAAIHEGIQMIQSRNWWSLFNTISVVALLTATIVCLTLPNLVQSTEPFAEVNIDLAVRGLIAMVLLFNIYAVWQQIRLKKMCDEIRKSLKSVVK